MFGGSGSRCDAGGARTCGRPANSTVAAATGRPGTVPLESNDRAFVARLRAAAVVCHRAESLRLKDPMTATYTTRGAVAVITLDNPPVNGLGHATRLALVDALNRAQADAAVRAIVITGAGKAFSGGADIREFGSPKALAEPNLLSVILALEAATKPVVAAVHSVVHGRWAGTGTGLPLPRGRRWHAGGAARGEDRPHPRRGRHAAPAARAGPGERAQPDRQGRSGAERGAGRLAGTEAVRHASSRATCWRAPASSRWKSRIGTPPARRCRSCVSSRWRTTTPRPTCGSRATPWLP